MSRYRWPARARSRDRQRQRTEWNALTDGLLLPDAIRSLRARRGPGAREAPQPGRPLWVPIGPSTVIRGQAASRPRISGRVRDIAVSPDGRRVYAATANAGVWYSADEGTTWTPLGGWGVTPESMQAPRAATALTCGCLLVTFGARDDGSEDEVYVGTGEIRRAARATPGGKQGGVGVLRLARPLPDALANPFGSHWVREAPNLAGRGIYRLARHPGGTETLVAATSMGLFFRTGAFVEDADWTRAPHEPFDHDADEPMWTTDVVWTTDPMRLWVAFVDLTLSSDTGVWMSNAGPDAPFHQIDLDDVVKEGRLGLAVAPKAHPGDPTQIYVLGSGPRLWRITGVESRRVASVPNKLFGRSADDDQSDYDLAITVHPDDPNVVVIGGSGADTADGWNASLYRATVNSGAGGSLALSFSSANQGQPANDPTYIGAHIHADVHQVRFAKVEAAPDPLRLWVCCDGGIFYSRTRGDRDTFVARNTGLATLECGYLSSHPTQPGCIVSGTQDNGTIERVGDTVWRMTLFGDGGGVMYNPRDGRYFAGQYVRSEWNHNEGTFPGPVQRPGLPEEDYKAEDRAASFYSGGDARRVAAPDRVRVAVGTNRVWMMEDWRPDQPVNRVAQTNTWVTLPSGVDPRLTDRDNSGTDVVDDSYGAVIACRWISDTRLLVLYEANIVLYTEPDAGLRWRHKALTPSPPSHCGDLENSDLPEGDSSDWLPPLGAWSDIAPHDPDRGPHGSFYVATIGASEIDDNDVTPADRMDTLWWFDGTSTYYKTGLRNDDFTDSQGTTAPAYAVQGDPDDRTVVYVGTALGVWRGTLSFEDDTPDWEWARFSNGLPEAPVHDLSWFSQGGVKLLRAAVQARGVWEVDLSADPTPTNRTYLRVHPVDVRRSLPTTLVNPFLRPRRDHFFWHDSPDIKVRRAPFQPFDPAPPPPASLATPWTSGSFDNYELWTYQTALHFADPLVVPDGRWTPLFSARLLARDAAIGDRVTAARWTADVTAFSAFQPPWDGLEPTEADFAERIVEPRVDFPEAGVTEEFGVFTREPYRVDVLVHHRDLRPIPASEVRVLLLRCALPTPGGPVTFAAFPINDAWRTAVAAFVRGEGPAGAIPAPWEVADPGTPIREPTQPVDARMPRAVTFEVDFSGLPATNTPSVLLLAIVHTTEDELRAVDMTGATVRDLVLNNHHVAAKIVTT